MEWAQIVQIILIPIITLLLTILWESIRDTQKRKREKDKKIFSELRESFESGRDLVVFFRDHSVGEPTHTDYISKVDEISRLLKRPGFLFSMRQLERLRVDLTKKIDDFIFLTSRNMFIHQKLQDHYELRYSMEVKGGSDPETENKFEQLYKKIDGVGTEIYRIYKELSDKAQKQL